METISADRKAKRLTNSLINWKLLKKKEELVNLKGNERI